jgi:hypothetical protein
LLDKTNSAVIFYQTMKSQWMQHIPRVITTPDPVEPNFFLTRADGTTAAERFFGQKPRSMFAAILASVEIPPAPLSPPQQIMG